MRSITLVFDVSVARIEYLGDASSETKIYLIEKTLRLLKLSTATLFSSKTFFNKVYYCTSIFHLNTKNLLDNLAKLYRLEFHEH